MLLDRVCIKGYRNFNDLDVRLREKTLIIGANDVGKTNFMRAIRLVLDKTLSYYDLEPQDNDFYAFTETNEILVELYFSDVVEDYLKRAFGANISNDNEVLIQYRGFRVQGSGGNNFSVHIKHPQGEASEEDSSRRYLKYLNMDYMQGQRSFTNSLKKQKKRLLTLTRDKRTEDEILADDNRQEIIGELFEKINLEMSNLHYIGSACLQLSKQMKFLSSSNEELELSLERGEHDVGKFVESLGLVSNIEGVSLELSGDGRKNQIIMALWALQKLDGNEIFQSCSLSCIEEPEAHLHPHQQRMLARYLIEKLPGQVLITSHSPHIACEFSPSSIVSLGCSETGTVSMNKGCSDKVEDCLHELGHRLNVIPAEGFFAQRVLLVEGPSEVLLYKALARVLNIPLDRHNVSVIPVQGVGFKVFIEAYKALGVKVVVRTDFDIYKVQGQDLYQAAGLSRALSIWELLNEDDTDSEMQSLLKKLGRQHKKMKSSSVSSELESLIRPITNKLENAGIYLSSVDLETDLANSLLFESLCQFYFKQSKVEKNDLIEKMKNAKGQNMYQYLLEYSQDLHLLRDSDITAPLNRCVR